VEQAAMGDDERVRRAAAVGIPWRNRGERVVLVLEASPDKALRGEVEDRLREAGHAVDEIIISDARLPVDPRHNSKIDYDRLRLRLRRRFEAEG
jgi:acyl-CoA synthetase (AMP-forming)/AMP-acid ligase II